MSTILCDNGRPLTAEAGGGLDVGRLDCLMANRTNAALWEDWTIEANDDDGSVSFKLTSSGQYIECVQIPVGPSGTYRFRTVSTTKTPQARFRRGADGVSILTPDGLRRWNVRMDLSVGADALPSGVTFRF